MNILLTVEYDGSAYNGWQRQPSQQGITVQQVLEDTLSKLLAQKTVIHGASRTDTGVHAVGQRCNFRCDTPLPSERLPLALNHKLPADIRITAAQQVDDDFHAQFSACGKQYRYVIERFAPPSAFTGRYSWQLDRELDVAAMREAAQYLLGKNDFRHYTLTAATVKTFIRRIDTLTLTEPATETFQHPWQQMSRPLLIDIAGSGFLYKMVRIIVGRLAAVGCGKITPEDMRRFLTEPCHVNIPPAPAGGLMLRRVDYEGIS